MNQPSRRTFLATLTSLCSGALAWSRPGTSLASPPPSDAARPIRRRLTPDDPDFLVEAMRQLDDMYRGRSSHGLMEMEVKTKHWTRNIAMESWSLGEKHSLVRIVAPKKEKGTATLKSGDDLFTYLSKTGRTIKITGGMMGGSWMGSHFTNDDLIQGARLSDDFQIHRNVRAEAADSYAFTLVPKPDAAVVWGKIDVVLRRSDLLPLEQRFYDEDGSLTRRMLFSGHEMMAGRVIPTRIRMEPLDKAGEYTQMRHKRLEFDVAINESFFTLQKLRSL